jgi:WD40 repeat protein
MKHHLPLLLGGLLLAGLLAVIAPLRTARAQTEPVPITPDAAAQVVELARFGRGIVQGATWSPDGSLLLVYGSIGVWLYESDDLAAQPTWLTDYGREAQSAVFNHEGTHIVAAGDEGTAQVWDLVAGQATLSLNIAGRLRTARAAISPDGSRIVMSSHYDLQLYDAATGEQLVELTNAHRNTIVGLGYSPDGSRIVSCSSDNTARLWDANNLTEVAVIEGHTNNVNAVAFSPDGSRIVTVGNDRTARLWDSTTGAEVTILENDRSNILAVDYSSDGRLVAIGNLHGGIHLLDAESLTVREVWEDAHESAINSVVFSPDGTQLASTGTDQAIRLWDVASGEMLAAAPGHMHPVGSLGLSPDETMVIVGTYDGTLRVWDLTGDDAHPHFMERHRISPYVDSLNIAGFSPDGAYFAAIQSGIVRVWDASSSQLLHEMEDNQFGTFRSMSFNPEGSLIAVTTRHGTVQLWDVRAGELLHTLDRHAYGATSVIFTRDGSLMISGGADGTVRVWGLPATADALGLMTSNR